jgi:hypothetical protein
VRAHRVNALGGEVRGHHAAQPVVLGIIHPRKDQGHVGIVCVCLVKGLDVRADPWIRQSRPDVVVTADRPDRLAPPQRPLQALGVPPFGEFGGWM